MGFRRHGSKDVPESVRERFWEVLNSGMSPTAAATVAGVHGATGRAWARAAGYRTDPKHYGTRYSGVVRDRFWEAMHSGATVTEAAVIAGMSEVTAQYWVSKAGYVPRTVVPADIEPDPSPPRGPMSFVERCWLEQLLETGHTPGRAAELLGRHPDTIGRERQRGQTHSGYRARVGQERTDANLKRPKSRHLESRPALLAEVVARLEQRHSPEQIAGRLREDFPDDPEMWVSHEAIYQALFVQGRGSLRRELHQCLRTKRAVRRPQHQPGTRRGHIPGMVNISERPAEADDRAVPGHWEGDLIMGSTASNSAIGTLVERTTRFVMLLHLPEGHGAQAVQDAIIAKMSQLPAMLRRSLTWDQGKEMANHAAISLAADLDIYFCDPHSPWQRGTNENTNGLLRQWFPKGTDLSVFPADYLDYVATLLNNRPRQTLDWRTPAEALNELLSKPPTVASTA
jgi:IS30 family transposase